MRAKKIAMVVGLLVVIAAACLLFVKKSGMVGGVRPSKEVLGQTQERIDINTGELVTKTLGEWDSLGEKEGLYKNPTSGEYTMVNVIDCKGCGEKIASPTATGGSAMSPCPKCGNNPFVGKIK